MNILDNYITFIIFLKLLFIGLSLLKLFHKYKYFQKFLSVEIIDFWKKRIEFIFIASISLFIIYIFNPFVNRTHKIDLETRYLLYLFGFILLISADWNAFINQTPYINFLQNLIS